jgi:peptidyl-tRNA hydrolase, PTH1 family
MLLFVGLGNPGAGYAGHRHNVGFMALDAIAARHGIAPWRRRFQGVAAEGAIGVDRALLLKPGTYMNESGRAVAEAVRFYKIAPHDTLVFHDEIDLAPGKVRVKIGGGTAGHNGLKSIQAHLHDNGFVRVRIGVDKPPGKRQGADHVLRRPSKSDKEALDVAVEVAADAVEAILEEGPDAAMNRFNSRPD